MQYQVSRNGQVYGPYTLEDIQRYLASGNILPTDLAKTDDGQDWRPVSQLLGAAAPPADFIAHNAAAAGASAPATPALDPLTGQPYAQPSQLPYAQPYGQPGMYPQNAAALANSPYPDAPNLSWGLYLLFTIISCGLFSKVFTCVQAAWLKKVQPNTIVLYLYLGAYGLWLVTQVVSGASSMASFQAIMNHGANAGAPLPTGSIVAQLLSLVYFGLIFTTRMITRNSLQEHFNTVEPIGLQLNPVMAFFFGGVYFQAELNKINQMKQMARMNAGRGY